MGEPAWLPLGGSHTAITQLRAHTASGTATDRSAPIAAGLPTTFRTSLRPALASPASPRHTPITMLAGSAAPAAAIDEAVQGGRPPFKYSAAATERSGGGGRRHSGTVNKQSTTAAQRRWAECARQDAARWPKPGGCKEGCSGRKAEGGGWKVGVWT